MSTLGDNLKKYRLKMDLSQEEIAKQINITRGTYSRYETGTLKPDVETLVKLADIYQTSTDMLLGRAKTIDELLKLIPGYAVGQDIGNNINRKRVSKRIKKDQ